MKYTDIPQHDITGVRVLNKLKETQLAKSLYEQKLFETRMTMGQLKGQRYSDQDALNLLQDAANKSLKPTYFDELVRNFSQLTQAINTKVTDVEPELEKISPELSSLVAINSITKYMALQEAAQSQNKNLQAEDLQMITAICNLSIQEYLLNYFILAEGLSDQDADELTDFVVAKLIKAMVSGQNIPLQEFYGQDDPKNLRGQIKPGSTKTFKDTDHLRHFLSNNLLIL